MHRQRCISWTSTRHYCMRAPVLRIMRNGNMARKIAVSLKVAVEGVGVLDFFVGEGAGHSWELAGSYDAIHTTSVKLILRTVSFQSGVAVDVDARSQHVI